MKKIKTIILILVSLVVIVLLVGVYKFNFTNDDIYVENKDGSFVNIDDKKEDVAVELSLDSKTWSWVKTIYNNDTEVKPLMKDKFTITFIDKTFSATTDCNNMGGDYVINDNQISFKNIFQTEMYCENSQEMNFLKMLNETQSYFITPEGKLILEMKFDTGSIIFE